MYVVGLTGGIGSGKSVAAAHFAELGVTVVNSDLIAREIVEPGTETLAAIVEQFGNDVLLADGQLNRAALRAIIFQDDHKRQWLEALTHPIVIALTEQRLNAERKEGEPPYRIMESPLLFESERYRDVDRLLLIDTNEAMQIQRVIDRDNNKPKQVQAIIDSQMSREEKRRLAHDIVDNSGTLAELHEQINQLHLNYCEYADAAMTNINSKATSEIKEK